MYKAAQTSWGAFRMGVRGLATRLSRLDPPHPPEQLPLHFRVGFRHTPI